jgi:hypothetical protein
MEEQRDWTPEEDGILFRTCQTTIMNDWERILVPELSRTGKDIRKRLQFLSVVMSSPEQGREWGSGRLDNDIPRRMGIFVRIMNRLEGIPVKDGALVLEGGNEETWNPDAIHEFLTKPDPTAGAVEVREGPQGGGADESAGSATADGGGPGQEGSQPAKMAVRPWTAEEDERLRRVHDQVGSHAEMLERLPGRTLAAVKTRAGVLGLRKRASFTGKADAIVGKAVEEGAATCAAVAVQLPDRSAGVSLVHGTHQLGLKIGAPPAWTGDEDATLRRLVGDGATSWAEVAKSLPLRTRRAVEGHANRLGLRLCGTREELEWSGEEEAALRQAIAEGATSWREVAAALPDRGSLPARSKRAVEMHAYRLGLSLDE